MPLQLIAAIHPVKIGIHLYKYKSHFPHLLMYYYISSCRVGWCFILVSSQHAIPLSLSYIISILMFVVYLGEPEDDLYHVMLLTPFHLLYLIKLYAMFVNLELGIKYHIISHPNNLYIHWINHQVSSDESFVTGKSTFTSFYTPYTLEKYVFCSASEVLRASYNCFSLV